MLKYREQKKCHESDANDVMMRSGSHDSKHVEQIASHLGHKQTRKHTQTHSESNPSHLARNHTHPNSQTRQSPSKDMHYSVPSAIWKE